MPKNIPQGLECTVAVDGSVQMPAFNMPFSSLASPGAAEYYAWKHRLMKELAVGWTTLDEYVARWDHFFYKPLLEKLNALYRVDIQPKTIAGVYTEVITPDDYVPIEGEERVLINLHGGGFYMGARLGGEVESIPIAAVGRVKVISVDYRQAPEHCFPAASEDVAAVYQALLEEHRPENIGIYGCSAGAFLTAESMAWFQQENIPLPGAIGLIGAGAGSTVGDSTFIAGHLTDMAYGPPRQNIKLPELIPMYFQGASADNPLVSPIDFPAVLGKFPPTLLITGTRSVDLSAVVHDHAQLVKAGVEANLHVWEAMDHCFLYNPDLEESQQAYSVISLFFARHLGR